MEMRGADGGPWSQICALPAVWVGLLYDAEALSDAEVGLYKSSSKISSVLLPDKTVYSLRT
jgi:gamma-glutamylcysteine synthetase